MDAARLNDIRNTHSRWLCLFGFGSVVAGFLYFVAAKGPDGRDPFYVAVAMQFVIWGAIDASLGLVDLLKSWRRRMSSEQVMDGTHRLLRLLKWNRLLNVIWLLLGVGLIASGLLLRSPEACGHGVGVLFQGVSLAIADEVLNGRLRRVMKP